MSTSSINSSAVPAAGSQQLAAGARDEEDAGRVPAAAGVCPGNKSTVTSKSKKQAKSSVSRSSSGLSVGSSGGRLNSTPATYYSKQYRNIIAAEVALEDSLSATIAKPESHPVRLVSIRTLSDQDCRNTSSDISTPDLREFSPDHRVAAAMDESEPLAPPEVPSPLPEAPEGFADDDKPVCAVAPAAQGS